MKVYFVRHGQSQGNLDGIHQDGKVLLSEKGKQQAQEVANRFKHIKINVILSSDYQRAFSTAQAIAKITGHEITSSPLLREIKRPSEVEGKKYDDPEAVKIKTQIVENKHNPDFRFSDEETFFDVAQRAKKFIAELENRTEANILCVAHGDIIRNIIITMLIGDNYNPAIYEVAKKTMWAENTGITMCEFMDGEWKLLTWNDYAHLG